MLWLLHLNLPFGFGFVFLLTNLALFFWHFPTKRPPEQASYTDCFAHNLV